MRSHRRASFGLVALIVLAFFGFASAESAFAAETPSVAVGDTPAREGQMSGHKNPADMLRVTVTLNLRDADGLAQLIAAQSNPASPSYKKYITPKEFGARFGATAAKEAAVVRYLQSAGFHILNRAPEHTAISAEASVAKIEKAFGTTINNYRTANGRAFFAPADALRVPASIAPTVKGVLGVDNFEVWHTASKFDPNAHPMTGPAGGYTPSELRGAYDVAPLNSAGYTGTGQKVALFELDGFAQSNITTYVNNYSLGSPAPTVVQVDGGSGALGQGQVEVELDIEVVNAISPKANVAVYEGPNSNTGVFDTYQKIATNNTEKVISTSWGLCESSSGTSSLSSLDGVFSQMASQGQSIFAASGDSGAYDCGSGTSTLAVDNPADDPYVTGVGGTNLTVSGTSYSSERVWSNTSNKSGGGGGVSTYFAHPSWQTGTGTNTGIKRQVPDVSADADPASGYSIYSTGSWSVVGGTSAAAPLWAGVAAVHNQYAAANSKPNLGYANPTLYGLFNGSQTYPAFHDITSGTNLYYPATAGYDMASGIGTPDAYNLIRDLVGGSTGGGSATHLTFTTQPPSSVAAGTSFTVTVAAQNASNATDTSYSGTISLTSSPASVSTSKAATSGVASFSISISTAGTYTLSASASGLTGATSNSFSVTSGGGGSSQLILNGGFESVGANWTESSSGGYQIADTTRPHTGSYSAYLAGYNNGSDSLYQTITIPSSATSVTLTYYYYITTQETTTTTAYDKFSAQVRNSSGTVLTTLQSLSNLSTKGSWVQATYSLAAYKGQTVRIYFGATNDSSLPTSFFVDDVAVNVS